MRTALSLARRGLGRVAPNPAVGCLLVRQGRVAGRGWTQPGGRPHAETEALARAGEAARGATAYVTLEPCSHQGQTPPCVEALIAAGVARCVVAIRDPDPRVNGRGLAALRAAGLAVEEGLCGEAARDLNAGFILKVTQARPLVTVKLATSLDGQIATAGGQSKWITGPAAREDGHRLRAGHDAVMVGSGTALADDPRLDVRLPGLEAQSPLRVVLDGRLRLPLGSDLVAGAAERPTLLVSDAALAPDRLAPYRDAGVDLLPMPYKPGEGLVLAGVLKGLAARGVTRLLVEGGGLLVAGLLEAGLVDRLVIYRAGRALGGDGRPAVGPLGLDRVGQGPDFRMIADSVLGEDHKAVYERRQKAW